MFVLMVADIGSAQENAPTVEWGKELFSVYCAPCHGLGKGDGPVAPALKTRPADLTLISKNHGGQFPRDSVMKSIEGDAAVAAHGTREMPIWGTIFQRREGLLGRLRILALTQYVESIQQE